MNIKYKYEKYKKKYLNFKYNLRGGYSLLDKGITREEEETFLYPTFIKYLQQSDKNGETLEKKYNKLLYYINNLEYFYHYKNMIAIINKYIVIHNDEETDMDDDDIKMCVEKIIKDISTNDINPIYEYSKLNLSDFNELDTTEFFYKIIIAYIFLLIKNKPEDIGIDKFIKTYLLSDVKHIEIVKLISEKDNINEIDNININDLFEIIEIISNNTQILYIINDILNDTNRQDLIKYFITKYEESNVNYHINYSSLIYLNFILELELFLVIYSIKPYNYFISTPTNFIRTGYYIDTNIKLLNDYKIKWEDNTITYSIYNKKLTTNINMLLDDYLTFIENYYKSFVENLFSLIPIESNIDFYTNEKSYQHLKYENIQSINYLNIQNALSNTYPIYNSHQLGFFDLVFSLNNTGSCLTYSMLDFYILSRLHIVNLELYLQISNQDNSKDASHQRIQELLNVPITHWSTQINNNPNRQIDNFNTTIKIPSYNKINLFIAFIIEIFDRYDNIMSHFTKKHNNDDIICNTYERDNLFNIYNDILKTNYKYVTNLFVNFNIQQYKNKLIKEGIYLKYIPILNDNVELVDIAVSQNGLALEYASENLKNNKEIVKKAVTLDGLALEYASEKLKNDEEIVKKAVTQNGLALEYASEKLKNEKKIVTEAVTNNGLALEYVSSELQKDKDIVDIAMNQTWLVLNILKKIRSPYYEYDEIVIKAINKNMKAIDYAPDRFIKLSQNGLLLNNFPKNLKNNDTIVKIAVKQNGLALQYASYEMKTNIDILYDAIRTTGGLWLEFATTEIQNDESIVTQCVQNNGLALQFASVILQNSQKLVHVAVIQNGLALQFASSSIQKKIILVQNAVKQNGLSLEFAATELQKDEATVLIAVKQNGLALQFASIALQNNKNIVLIAVKQNGLALQFASNILQNNEDIVCEAISHNGLSLCFASYELQNNENIVWKAIQNNKQALLYSSIRLQTGTVIPEISNKNIYYWLIVLYINGLNLQFIEPNILTELLIFTAISQNGLSLEFVPTQFLTVPIMLEAIKQNNEAINYVLDSELPLIISIVIIYNINILYILNSDKYNIILPVIKDNIHALQIISTNYNSDIKHYNADGFIKELALKININYNIIIIYKIEDLIIEYLLNKDGLLLKFIIDYSKLNEKYIILALKQNGLALKFINHDIQTIEIIIYAIKQNGLALEFANKDILNHDPTIIISAVKHNGLALKYVDMKMQTYEIIIYAIKQNGLALEFANKDILNRNPIIIISAVKQNGLALKYVDMKMQTNEIIIYAIKQNGLALEFANTDISNHDPTIIIFAVKQNGLALQYVDMKMQTNEIIISAIKQNILALQYVNEDMKTEEIIRYNNIYNTLYKNKRSFLTIHSPNLFSPPPRYIK
uniref:DUF4116 domain-containing protein n=1 Tax=viral metagenome TaxID=1070528 RepID=A0A6C0H918_9ZZZZ